MSDKKLILLLKIVMIVGICLILTGVYCHMYSETVEAMGVTGIVLSACLVAVGMILSLPTKMYLTFILVKREADASTQARSN
ncbi:hypothetical protein [Alteromonas sp. AMM-1]|uniref:hypothetical protein n=1 Tax=Alteromonas sp. AMM-1 TaxID=3394233 RepID=UPI0039A6B343